MTKEQPTTVLGVLQGTRALLSDPNRWCQRFFARDADGLRVPSRSDDACRWCLAGAMRKVGGMDYPIKAYMVLVSVVEENSLSEFNDNHTHAEVLAALDRAIVLAKEN